MASVALVLLYQPTVKSRPVPLCRVDNPNMIARAAHAAIAEAQERANALSDIDDFLGEAEVAEVKRLTAVLGLLVPSVGTRRRRACARG